MQGPSVPSATQGGFFGKAYSADNPFPGDLQSASGLRPGNPGAFRAGPLSEAAKRLAPPAERAAAASQYLPFTSDWVGNWRQAGNNANDYMLDRDEQKNRTYTGIPTINDQDRAV